MATALLLAACDHRSPTVTKAVDVSGTWGALIYGLGELRDSVTLTQDAGGTVTGNSVEFVARLVRERWVTGQVSGQEMSLTLMHPRALAPSVDSVVPAPPADDTLTFRGSVDTTIMRGTYVVEPFRFDVTFHRIR